MFMRSSDPLNDISLRGMIWKRPVLRETPAGKEMAQFIAAVNRPAGKTDYIPCVCWGENARYAAELPGGSHVRITGRIQSRDYFKKEEAVRVVLNTVCEVYVRSIKAW